MGGEIQVLAMVTDLGGGSQRGVEEGGSTYDARIIYALQRHHPPACTITAAISHKLAFN